MDTAEHLVILGVQWLKLAVETTGALIVCLGFVIAAGQFARTIVARRTANFTAIRLVLARYLALALEFQLGADILSTAIAPSWQQIGKLGAIAVIRTGLNFFLSKEIQEEQATSSGEKAVQADAKREKDPGHCRISGTGRRSVSSSASTGAFRHKGGDAAAKRSRANGAATGQT